MCIVLARSCRAGKRDEDKPIISRSESPAAKPPFLSIVVPAYNEERRLPASLQAIHQYLAGRAYRSELIVVDDGSEDGTAAVAEASQAEIPNLRVIRNPHRGKAYALKSGVLASRGQLVFLCDADLSMPIGEIEKFLPYLSQGFGVAIGSREAPGAHRYGEPPHRHLMGRVFNYLVRLVVMSEFQDTQCGFKCLSREAAFEIFPRLQVRTENVEVKGPMVTGFDVELLYLARKLGYRVAEVGIQWHYAPGSKVNPVQDTLRMISDVLKVRINDRRGYYDLPGRPSPKVTPG
ncbi:MAG TPA: dolichyl-phosphate beta-glucosyltransferase [Chloroflexota bacterium]|nr:dolichyl-phosphate beta-glucosyltransferase [Chloroflexota bacterium]